ncbi:PREDICTED: uncharacterized protein LOC107164873, partial [Diuraphis noxia]|uniref:uncharacterized protein LOC107164873 n=1 Tax=Diuraphis noxia TaxID=143948 RepID=UPI000763994C
IILKIKGIDEFKSKDVQFLRQDINSMHQYIRRVLDSTNSNQINYNLIMTEIEHCKGIQNSCPNNFCEELNEELTALKCSITACLYNILYNKLESRTKISTEDSRLVIYPNHRKYVYSQKYIECVNFIKEFIKSDNTVNIDCSALRQNIISFMALKFPIGELVNSDECLDSANIIKKLNGAYDTVHTLLRAINILEFEYLYKYSQEDMHWHMRNPQLHVKHSKQAKEELNSTSISQNSYESIIHVYNEKLNEEINRSLSLEQEKMHWENEYKLLCKKKEIVSNDKYSSCSGAFTVENEITALKTRLDHSIFVRNNLEIKLHEASEHIDDLKEEFHLTSTNYETQLRAMTEHLASLNETVVLERRHIDDLNSQLKIKAGKKKSSK